MLPATMGRTGDKSETRRRILSTAARLFRERGYRGTSVDELMARAGLTRGGFYAHFRGKTELLREALSAAFAEAIHNLAGEGIEHLTGAEWVAQARQRYLSPGHVDERAGGCVAAALGAEIGSMPPAVRRTFAEELEQVIDSMAERIGGADARARAWRLLSEWSGAIVLARAVDDDALREEILAASREIDD